MTDSTRSQNLTDEMHSEVFTPEDYLEARAFEDFLDVRAYNLGLPVEINPEEIPAKQNNISNTLDIGQPEELNSPTDSLLLAIETTCERISGTVSSPIEDESASFIKNKSRELFNLKPFNQQLRYLASRFIVEYVERAQDSSTETWNRAIETVTYLLESLPDVSWGLYHRDIPAYTILYDEFDKLRVDEEYPLEVYLGRDGIYAYYGRLAQNAARGDNDPASNSFPMHPAQAALMPDPRYIVYSRGVMLNAPVETRKRYVLQFIDRDEVHFYDTGYHGSIPEDIMKILGFSHDKIDQRIHLLNSDVEERQLKGLAKVDIEPIESNPKDEHAAGTIEEHEGVLKYTSTPTSLEEQFKFLFIRDILLRHFWIKEYVDITNHLADVAVTAVRSQ